MNIQKTIAAMVACMVVASSNAHAQQVKAATPGSMTINNNKNRAVTKPSIPGEKAWTMPWATVSHCAVKNVRLDTNKVATQAYLRGEPISPALLGANRCHLARNNAAPIPIGTYAYMTRRSVSEALLAEGIRNNSENGEVFAASLANRARAIQ